MVAAAELCIVCICIFFFFLKKKCIDAEIYLSCITFDDNGLFPRFRCVTSRREHVVQVIPYPVY
jgi:hypothetical protein